MAASDVLGWIASATMLSAYFSKGTCRARALATATNLVFIAYACAAGSSFVLATHLLLLPVNATRLVVALRARRSGEAAAQGGVPPRRRIGDRPAAASSVER